MFSRFLRLVGVVALLGGTVVVASAVTPRSVSRRVEAVQHRISTRVPARIHRAHDKLVTRLERLKDRLFD